MIQVKRFSHATFETPDVERQVDYFSQVVGLAVAGNLGFHPVWLAAAIGCGSKPIWWMNDSGFWVVSKMGGLTEEESIRVLTPLSIVNGTTGLIATAVGAWLFPMA